MISPLREQLAQWSARATAEVAGWRTAPRWEPRGRLESLADGIAAVSGLADVQLDEMLRFEHGAIGYAAALEPDSVRVVMLDSTAGLEPGAVVRRTGRIVDVPVGDGLLGRVVDPLGRPIDGRGPVAAAGRLPADRAAPPIGARAAVREQVHTGTLVVDALFPLGRGQRELIIGDRGTGKTALAVDALLAQRDSPLLCVYAAIGQRSEATAAVIEAVQRLGAPRRTLFVVAAPTDPPGLQWLAPFAAFSMAEHFRDRGEHVLLVIDDLTKHAATHRELSLLMQQPPGREAYPGDIFHVHARLLERAARLSPALGGGSLTALPIAQTESGNLSALIPTNLISITDGQIVLDAHAFALGQLPAVDTGLSVSRVGGKTQPQALRQAVSLLRLEYSQFLELEAFTRFGTRLEPRVLAQIEHGRRIRAVLAQDRLEPIGPIAQLAILHALHAGLLDRIDPQRIREARDRLTRWTATPEGGDWARRLMSKEPDGHGEGGVASLRAALRSFDADPASPAGSTP